MDPSRTWDPSNILRIGVCSFKDLVPTCFATCCALVVQDARLGEDKWAGTHAGNIIDGVRVAFDEVKYPVCVTLVIGCTAWDHEEVDFGHFVREMCRKQSGTKVISSNTLECSIWLAH